MSEKQALTAKGQLLWALPRLYPNMKPDWEGKAISVIGNLPEEQAVYILSRGDDVQRAAIDKIVNGDEAPLPPTLPVDLDQRLKAALSEVLDARDVRGSSSSSQRFSAVGSSVAQEYYSLNGIMLDDGDASDPLCSNCLDCGSFDMSEYPDEKSATVPFLQHIEQSLKKHGVVMGRNGFSVKDVRSQNKMYQLRLPSGQLLSGGLDGAVLPYPLRAESARDQLRCGIKVKHSDAHKAAYKEKYQGMPVAGTETPVQFAGSIKGQALMEILAAAVYAQYPEIMLLHSSYDSNVILQFAEGRVTIWEGCSFNAAMAKMASFLRSCSSDRGYTFEQDAVAQSDAAQPVLQLRKKLKLVNPIVEQLDSLTAGLDRDAKFSTALEFFMAARYREHMQAAHVLASSTHDGPSMMHDVSYIS